MRPTGSFLQRHRRLALTALVGAVAVIAVASVVVPLDVENRPPDDALYGSDAADFDYGDSYTFHGTAVGRQTAGYVVWLPGTDGWGRVERVERERVRLSERGWYDADADRSYWRRRASGTAGESVVEKYTENGVTYHRIRGLTADRVTDYAAAELPPGERVVVANERAGVVVLAYGAPGDDPHDGFTPTLSRFTSAHVVPAGAGRYAFVAAGVERNASGHVRVTDDGIRVNSTVSQLYPQGVTHEYEVNAVTLLFGPRQSWEVSYAVTSRDALNRSRPGWVERAMEGDDPNATRASPSSRPLG
jgi:hypothetical protein